MPHHLKTLRKRLLSQGRGRMKDLQRFVPIRPDNVQVGRYDHSDLENVTILVATKRGLFLLTEGSIRLLLRGYFYGTTRRDERWLTFQRLSRYATDPAGRHVGPSRTRFDADPSTHRPAHGSGEVRLSRSYGMKGWLPRTWRHGARRVADGALRTPGVLFAQQTSKPPSQLAELHDCSHVEVDWSGLRACGSGCPDSFYSGYSA